MQTATSPDAPQGVRQLEIGPERDGQRIDNMRAAELRAMRKRVQVVFQDPFSSLNPRQRVRDIDPELAGDQGFGGWGGGRGLGGEKRHAGEVSGKVVDKW